MKIENFYHFQKLLPLLLCPISLANSEKKALCDVLFKERGIRTKDFPP